jgi:ketosteroid isomerase-like protein
MSEDLLGGASVRLRMAFEHGDDQVTAKSIEAENVRVIQRQLRALASGDLDGFVELLHDHVEMEVLAPPSVPFPRRLSGPRQVAEGVRNNFAQLEEHRSEIQSVVAQGNQVVVMGRDRGRFRATGQAFDMHWVHCFTFRDGKVEHMRELVVESANG